MSRVNFFWLADFQDITPQDVRLRHDKGTVTVDRSTGSSTLDTALRRAGEVLTIEGLELLIRLHPHGLQVQLPGGTWLGIAFGERISETKTFTDTLVQLLGEHYPALDPAEWTIKWPESWIINWEKEGFAIVRKPEVQP